MSCRAATLLPQNYRFAEYAAYYRYVKARLESACDGAGNSEGEAPTYPEPCAHCNVCRWWQECKKQWREDDHLSLVASITRLQRDQLERWDKDTVARLAAMELPLRERPLHGSREGYVRVREQARVQVDGRTRNQLVHEMLEVAEGMGLCELAEPSPGDLFVDLEGDQFVDEGGRQYLFGMLQMPEKTAPAATAAPQARSARAPEATSAAGASPPPRRKPTLNGSSTKSCADGRIRRACMSITSAPTSRENSNT
jgi:predicted RecB family nuclease